MAFRLFIFLSFSHLHFFPPPSSFSPQYQLLRRLSGVMDLAASLTWYVLLGWIIWINSRLIMGNCLSKMFPGLFLLFGSRFCWLSTLQSLAFVSACKLNAPASPSTSLSWCQGVASAQWHSGCCPEPRLWRPLTKLWQKMSELVQASLQWMSQIHLHVTVYWLTDSFSLLVSLVPCGWLCCLLELIALCIPFKVGERWFEEASPCEG